MVITADQLRRIMPHAKAKVALFAGPLSNAMAEFNINTSARAAAFLAQVAHESGELRYVEEIASGSAYDTGSLAKRLGNTEEADGDGQLYKGHGLIQVTGRANHLACSWALFGDERLLETPNLLCEPVHAARSAAWFWDSRKLNALADKGDFRGITRKINGGYNHHEQRVAYWMRARDVLGDLVHA